MKVGISSILNIKINYLKSPGSAALVGATDLNTFQLQSESEERNLKLSHENKKALSPFYRKKNF